MIDVTMHFRGFKCQDRQVAAIPTVGSYISADDRLWLVDNVVFGDGVDVYALEVSSGLADELRVEWAAWTKTATVAS